VTLQRNDAVAHDRTFSLDTSEGRRIEGPLPDYSPPSVKTAAGYCVAPDMDLVDLFIGSEGTLGIFTSIELKLIPAPTVSWAVTAFLPSEAAALDFVCALRGAEQTSRPAAIEYFDHGVLALLRRRKEGGELTDLPDIPVEYHTGVYVEHHADTEDAADEAMLVLCEALEGATWTAMEPHEHKRLHDFRHAVPESVNAIIDERRKKHPGLTKLGTDMAVPDEHLADVINLYRQALTQSGLENVLFGHIGNNHIHVNILPRSPAEYDQGKALYLDWARQVVDMGGTVSAEHGIGKLKRAFLELMYGPEAINQMRHLKHLFDPTNMLNPGNLFENLDNSDEA